MSFTRAVGQALQRSIEMVRDETVKVLRMEVAPSSATRGPLQMFSLTSSHHLFDFATGSDVDLGGLSQCRLGLDESSRGRFYGTLTSQVPRGAKLERSGYVGFRSRNRPTLFGNQCWDTTLHPYLALRVRNALAQKPSSANLSPSRPVTQETDQEPQPSSSSAGSPLRAALHAHDTSGPATARAIHALGLGRREPPGPKYFVNIQTDGPVTSDLFQHRLYFDELKGSEWQTIIIPFDDFVLTNLGEVSTSQVSMMREKIRTVGISAVLNTHLSPSASSATPSTEGAPSSLSKASDSAVEFVDGDFTLDSKDAVVERGSKRGVNFNFDLGIQAVYAVGDFEQAEGLF